jgi:hypothetical protein
MQPGLVSYLTIHLVQTIGGDMKFRLTIILSLLVLVALAACNGSPAPVVTAEPPVSVTENAPAETEPTEAYPVPAQQEVVTEVPQVAAGEALYPGPQSGETVAWAQAIAMINNGEISQIIKAQSLELTLTLKDGRSLLTNEPVDGELQSVLDRCGDGCGEIEVTGP